MNRDELIAKLKALSVELKQRYDIQDIYLFGSFATDTQKKKSDVDIAIRTDIVDYFKLCEIKRLIERRLKRKVDLVRIRKDLCQRFLEKIEKEGVRVG